MLRLPAVLASLLLPAVALAAGTGPTVDHAWARATPGAARTTAAYLRMRSDTPDRLVALATPVAGKTELHTHVEQNGLMQMVAVEHGLDLPAGATVDLLPGGLVHVMLTDLRRPLKAGETFPLTLTFEHAGPREVAVHVERLGAMGPSQ